MDFSLTAEQEEIRDLSSRIVGDFSAHERLKEVEAGDDHVDRRLWQELASAGLLGLALPETSGGAGLGFVETCLLVEEVGRHAAYVPVLETLVLGAGPVARHASPALAGRWLPKVAAGDTVLSAALVESGADPFRPARTVATPSADGWELTGAKSNVPAGHVAEALVVSAALADGSGVGLFLVESRAPGVRVERQETTSGRPEARVTFDDVPVGSEQALATGPEGQEALDLLLQHAEAATCVEVAGACQAALALTAHYTSERQQFDKIIATFQAVGQRAADAYIDTEAVRLTAWQAAWRLADGRPSAEAVAIAKFWADDGAQRVVHACQHLHGGVGVDRDYPLHRYYLLVKQLALTLGGTTTSLLRLGELMAAEPA